MTVDFFGSDGERVTLYAISPEGALQIQEYTPGIYGAGIVTFS